jgi:hypothetical protein
VCKKADVDLNKRAGELSNAETATPTKPKSSTKKKGKNKSSNTTQAAASTTPPKRTTKTRSKKVTQVVAPSTPSTSSPTTANGAPPSTTLQQNTTAAVPTVITSTVAKPQVKEKELEYPEDVISFMMFTFGDIRKPLPETCKIVEQHVKKCLLDMIQKAADVTVERIINSGVQFATPAVSPASVIEQSTKSKRKEKSQLIPAVTTTPTKTTPIITIEIQDLLSIFRCNPQKLRKIERILRRLEKINYAETKMETGEIKKRKRSFPASSMEEFASARKRLRKIDMIISIFDDERLQNFQVPEEEDEGEASIKEALTELSKLLSPEDFADYCKCREVSFLNHGNTKKFTTWLNLPKKYNIMDDRINEVLAYLAYELVGQVTQTALIVKRDMQMIQVLNAKRQRSCHEGGMDYFSTSSFYNSTGLLNEEVEKLMGKAAGVMDDNMRKVLCSNAEVLYFGNSTTIVSSGLQLKPITITHVLEAIRRLNERKCI